MKRRRSVAPALLIAPLMLVALAGCGSPGSGDSDVATVSGASAQPSASPSTSVAADQNERRLQFTRCLREQGLDVPDPDPNGGFAGGGGNRASVDPKKLREAFDACERYAGGNSGGRSLSEADKQKMLEFTTCLRQQGIDIGDPDPDTGRPQMQNLAKLRNDPKFAEAQKACAQHRPERLGGGGGR